MSTRQVAGLAIVVAAAGLAYTAGSQTPTPGGKAAGADADAIRQTTRDFEAAFNKGDAKAVAALWTEHGECRDADGQTYTGRAAIEAAYTAAFKADPGAQIEVLVKSVRFPAKDVAVEEGLLRFARGPKDLPAFIAKMIEEFAEGRHQQHAAAE